MYCIVLYCIVLYCIALHCIVLYCIVLYCCMYVFYACIRICIRIRIRIRISYDISRSHAWSFVFLLFYDSRNSDSRSGGQAGCEDPLPRGALHNTRVLPLCFNPQLSFVLICILCFCVLFYLLVPCFCFSLPFTPNLFSSQAERSLRLLLPLAVTEWRQR